VDGHAYEDSPRPELAPFLPEGLGSLLDVGCHMGAYGLSVKERFPQTLVWGIEARPEPAAIAASRLDQVVEGLWPHDMPLGVRFDCITFNDVLEHLVDPWAALTSTHDFLEQGGCVIASIPNVRRLTLIEDLLLRGRWTYTDEGLLDRTHLRFFTKSSVRELFLDAGFDVESIDAIGLLPGRRGRVLARMGALGEELRALQWVVVGRQRRRR